jgi:hypothetical protein
MADLLGIVTVEEFAIEESFDRKHKQSSALKTAMKQAAEKAVNRSTIVKTKGTATKDTKQFDLGGGVSKLTTWNEKDAVYIKAEMVMQGSVRGRGAFAFATGKKTFGQINEKKIDKEVQDLLAELVDEMIKKDVLKELEKKAAEK